MQTDGNASCSSVSSYCHTPNQRSQSHTQLDISCSDGTLNISSSTCSTEFETDDEVDPVPPPANFFEGNSEQTSKLPLCMLLNARSLYNKVNNFKKLLYEVAPDLAIVSETWERQNLGLEKLLNSTQFKSISYCRPKVGTAQPGGGCAIIYNENRFGIEELDVSVPESIEAAWAVFTCKDNSSQKYKVNKIVVGSIYVSPRSRHKIGTIDHIIEVIHFARAKYGNEVHFLLGGDFNRLDVGDIIDAHGALKQFNSVPTRKEAILELLLTDLHPFYHPSSTLPPLQVDEDKNGHDSDHDIVVLAPKSNCKFKVERKRKTITTRPLPESGLEKFGQEITSHTWDEVISAEHIDEQAMLGSALAWLRLS